MRETKQRLLEAAGNVFAAHGYDHATVREICRAARANVAAVNYHFRGKAGLYTEVLTYGAHQAILNFPPDAGLGPDPLPEERLHAFIHSFLCRFLDERQQGSWHSTLCAREMVEPTKALDSVVRQIIRPMAEQLEAIVRLCLGPKAPTLQVRHCAMSIVGQCLHYYHSRAVIERLYGASRYDAAEIRALADHITRFSLAALQALRRTKEPS